MLKYRKDEGSPPPDPTLYHRLIGSFLYLTMTLSDIAHLYKLSSANFWAILAKPRLLALYHMLQYICGMAQYGLFYLASLLKL